MFYKGNFPPIIGIFIIVMIHVMHHLVHKTPEVDLNKATQLSALLQSFLFNGKFKKFKG